MHRKYLLFTILFIQYINLFAQQNKLYFFTINGVINADTGTVKLKLLGDPDFYPENLRSLSAKVENKRFSIAGQLPSPQGFELHYSSGYYSGIFVIQAGTQSININIDSSKRTPQIQNEVMKEYFNNYLDAFKEARQRRECLDKKWDSLNILYKRSIPDSINLRLVKELKATYRESDITLLKYVTTNPNSYVAFWKLINYLKFSYEPIFDSIFNQFSNSLKTSYAGRVYSSKLNIASLLGIGKIFPLFPVVNNQDLKITKASFAKSKYTLIDFWYSNCGPCIAQFPKLKTIYEKYKDNTLEIVGISTDQLKNKEKWQAAIERYQLLWPQYWDKDGLEASKLSIIAFPTNFLLDNQGRIIKNNITPVELERFLSEHTK